MYDVSIVGEKMRKNLANEPDCELCVLLNSGIRSGRPVLLPPGVRCLARWATVRQHGGPLPGRGGAA